MYAKEFAAHIRPLIDGWPHPVFILNMTGCILIANKAVRNMGFPMEKFAGHFFSELVEMPGTDMQTQLHDWARETAAKPVHVRINTGNVAADVDYMAYGHAIMLGETGERGVQVRLIRLHQAFNKVHALNAKVDALSKKLHDEKIKSSVRQNEFSEMQRTLEERTRLLAATSHELRTPLNAIIGFSQMIRDGYVTGDKLKEYANDIYNSGHLLLSLVNDLLNYSASLAAAAEPNPTLVSVSSLLESVEKTVHGFVLKSGKRLDIRADRAPETVTVDNRMGIQVLTNLITNAAKYSSPSHPHIALRVRRQAGYAIFSVVDRGPGMTPEEVNNAMKPYVQLKKSVDNQMGGVGLGLSLVQHMVTKNGGEFKLWSKQGLGTVARVKLKLGTPPAPEANDNTLRASA
jgi:signal transduction histidine kinase